MSLKTLCLGKVGESEGGGGLLKGGGVCVCVCACVHMCVHESVHACLCVCVCVCVYV